MKFLLLPLFMLLICSCHKSKVSISESFETFPCSEELVNIETSSGIWNAEDGHALVRKDKARTGKNSLHILGGENRSVVLNLKQVAEVKQLNFYAERWTQRDPFSFKVYKQKGDSWEEIYDGSKKVKAGHFSTSVQINFDIPEVLSALKFEATSPENTGVLIDDLYILGNQRQELSSIDVSQPIYPVLTLRDGNPILCVNVKTEGIREPLKLDELTFNINGTTNKENIEEIKVFYAGGTKRFNTQNQQGVTLSATSELTFKTQQILQHGANYFWLSFKLKDDASSLDKYDASCVSISVDGKTITPENGNPEGVLRGGVALRKHMDNGINTYRIPGLATTNDGTLIAVYDNRRNSGADLQEDVDVGMSRSIDGGITWEPMEIIMDMGEWGGLSERENGIGDPAVLVDRKTGTIWVAAVWAHGHPGQRNWWASKPGMTPEMTSQFVLVKSEDDGKTWSDEINITNQIKKSEWYLLLQGPGKGITLKDGTLCFPAQFKDKNQMAYSTIITSKNGGKTWRIGTGAKSNTTEAQVIQLDNGSLMLNMRDNRNGSDKSETNGRSVYVTSDLGKTWEKHPTSRTNALKEPTCMASIIKDEFIVNGEKRNLVLFSNPNSKYGRHMMTIKASFDDGNTWSIDKQLLLDEGYGAGYSCMTKIDDNTVGILYEGSQANLIFQAVKIDEILKQ